MAYDANSRAKFDEANETQEAQGQPLAAQANIGGSNHSASVSDSYYSQGPRNGFLELHILNMGLTDFMKRLEKVDGVEAVTLLDKVALMSRGCSWGHQQCLEVLYSLHPKNPVEFGLNHRWRTYRCACWPALGSPHRYVCTPVCTHGFQERLHQQGPRRGVGVYRRVLQLPKGAFRVLHTAVHDVAFKPERHVLSSQRQPLAASSSWIPARGEEDAVLLTESANLPIDVSVLM